MQRQIFEIADTGFKTIVGSSFFGEIAQMFWKQTAGDTGGTMTVGLYTQDGDADTGHGFHFLTAALTPNLRLVPRQPTHDINGEADVSDTGTPVSPVPIVAAGDHLRVTLAPGATATGKLYVWSRD
jgi:hypothetical protein